MNGLMKTSPLNCPGSSTGYHVFAEVHQEDQVMWFCTICPKKFNEDYALQLVEQDIEVMV
mgnify:CR=1 FL=1